MPTGRCELGGDVCDLNKVPHSAVSTLRQHEARLPVEGFFCFEINNRNAVRRRWSWQMEKLAEGWLVESKDDLIGAKGFTIFQNEAERVVGDGGNARVEAKRGGWQLRGK
jgi:hypothetical protein